MGNYFSSYLWSRDFRDLDPGENNNKQLSDVLVFYCCCNKLPQTYSSKVQHRSLWAKIKVLTGLYLSLGENSFPNLIQLLEAAYSLGLMVPLLYHQSQQRLVESLSHCLAPTSPSASLFHF